MDQAVVVDQVRLTDRFWSLQRFDLPIGVAPLVPLSPPGRSTAIRASCSERKAANIRHRPLESGQQRAPSSCTLPAYSIAF